LNIGWWNANFLAYEVSQNGQVLTSLTTFDMILQTYFLSDFTSYISVKDGWNFDYVQSQQQLPYTKTFLSFLKVIYNSYYVILPQLTYQFRLYIKAKQQLIILVPVPIVPICGVVLGLVFMLIIVTLVLRLKIVYLNYGALQILKKIKL
jgi:hypothetical protein